MVAERRFWEGVAHLEISDPQEITFLHVKIGEDGISCERCGQSRHSGAASRASPSANGVIQHVGVGLLTFIVADNLLAQGSIEVGAHVPGPVAVTQIQAQGQVGDGRANLRLVRVVAES